ncbi:hypothetical protein CY34DRAFT_328049 [Suillus luteus UH-Slu-Lm8-n1]|uniref:Uncharacterized protein n=1 Tax=Suillus luteus UH-Slu-Lm8-n1 TaxID=930992 RepID=A0A0D0AYZ3_9AGAM|nr:hypothetical protein CY34DRAFT_328049 [Suillus luteus UH-Slu-Lm8-n1]
MHTGRQTWLILMDLASRFRRISHVCIPYTVDLKMCLSVCIERCATPHSRIIIVPLCLFRSCSTKSSLPIRSFQTPVSTTQPPWSCCTPTLQKTPRTPIPISLLLCWYRNRCM